MCSSSSSSSSSVLTVSLCLLLCLCRDVSSGVSQVIQVKPGEDATLPCRSSGDAEVALIKWIRPDLKSEGFVFHYRQSHFHEDTQHPSYRGRVELKDPEMKNGDVSVILKNVTFNDAGRYECHVGDRGSKPELISIIDLTVQDSVPETIRSSSKTEHNLQVHQSGHTEKHTGDEDGGNKGLYIGLGVALFVVAAVGGFIVYRKSRKLTEHSSSEVGYTAAETDQPADPAVRVEIHEPDPGPEGLEEPGPQAQDQL